MVISGQTEPRGGTSRKWPLRFSSISTPPEARSWVSSSLLSPRGSKFKYPKYQSIRRHSIDPQPIRTYHTTGNQNMRLSLLALTTSLIVVMAVPSSLNTRAIRCRPIDDCRHLCQGGSAHLNCSKSYVCVPLPPLFSITPPSTYDRTQCTATTNAGVGSARPTEAMGGRELACASARMVRQAENGILYICELFSRLRPESLIPGLRPFHVKA